MHIIKVGAINIMTYSDYFFCSFILKGLLSRYSTVLVSSSSAYLTAYYTMFVFVPAVSITTNLVTFVGQMLGNENFEGAKRVFYQSIIIQFLILVLVNGIALFFIDDFLSLLGATKEQIEISRQMIFLAFPAIIIRIVNDIIKSLISTQDCSSKLGLFFWINFLPFSIYSWILIGYLELGIYGFCISLGLIEISGHCFLQYMIHFEINPQIFAATLTKGIFEDFLYLLGKMIIGMFVYGPAWLAYEFMLYFAAYKNNIH